MSRTSRVRALALFALFGAAGCQDYNFNPVGDCVMLVGRRQVTLSDISSADVLFVIDDSGSMKGEQTAIATEFHNFIDNLNQTNLTRVAQGRRAIDFHLTVTTTSVFENDPAPDGSNPQCKNGCGGLSGNYCCRMSGSTPVGLFQTVKRCTDANDTSCSGNQICSDECISFHGEFVCCDKDTHIPKEDQSIACTNVDTPCGALRTHYHATSTCTLGNAVDGDFYPRGRPVAAPGNPLVIHFPKSMYEGCSSPPCPDPDGHTVTDLQTMFSQNVQVGTCGSNQEQPLEAARRAIAYWQAQDAGTREFLHADAKLVLVFVGDEDDCSSPEDSNLGILLSGDPGNDSCVHDASLPPDQQKQTPVSSYIDVFTGYSGTSPFGGAFIVSARGPGGTDTCQDQGCQAGICCDHDCTGSDLVCTTNVCGGQAPGVRLLETAAEMRSEAADVVAGSICDSDWGTTLSRIAEIVKPPTGLVLPTQPAGAEITVLRVTKAKSSSTRVTCNGPAPSAMTLDEAKAPASASCPDCPYDWWFTASAEQLTPEEQAPTVATRYIYINHDTGHCEASPGESFSAEYMGRTPELGCQGATAEEADQNCADMLGGAAAEWTCFAGVDDKGACLMPTGELVGTCLCGPRGGSTPTPHGNCPAD
jgi:hypothetical protein